MMNLVKNILILLPAFCFGRSFAQINNPDSKENTNVTVTIVDTINKVKPLYILDDIIVSETVLKNIDPKMLLKVGVLREEAAIAKYGSRAKAGAILIVTIKFAVQNYQNKLSSLSKQYKQYLKKYNGDDKLLFVINGVEYSSSSQERIEKLYKIFSDDAVFSSFELTYVTGTDTIPSSVNLNTKTI